jgi:hypothetical protein
MKLTLIGAETAMLSCYGGEAIYPVDTAYDKITGKRQYVRHYVCPNHKEHWYSKRSKHDKYFTEDIVKK